MISILLAAAIATQTATSFNVEKVFLPPRYLPGDTNIGVMQPIDEAAWIWHPDSCGDAERIERARSSQRSVNLQAFPASWSHPEFLRFRKEFAVKESAPVVRIHVSADERFELYCDGTRIARGPDRGDPDHWSYATYDITLKPGSHTLEALVCRLGPFAPWAQTSWRGGFILKAEGEYDAVLTTGKAGWQAAVLPGTKLSPPTVGPFAVGAQYEMTGCGMLQQEGEYKKCIVIRQPVYKGFHCGLSVPGWHLYPSVLPDQFSHVHTPGRIAAVASSSDEKLVFTADHGKDPRRAEWQKLLDAGSELTIPANSEVTALWDLGDYYCAYPRLTVDGGNGSTILWSWAEALFDAKGIKGNRNEFEGKKLPGMNDIFHPDGRKGAVFMPMWWRSGRWCALRIKTGAEPLTLKKVEIEESRYPCEPEDAFACDDTRFPGIRKITLRGIQMCMHETYVDCPYYEQQMYPGDTRVQMLVNYLISADDRLAKRAIDLLDYSRRDSGLTGMNYPTWGTQDSVTYSLIWPLMLDDCLKWRRCDKSWLKAKVLGLRSLMAGVAYYERDDGLIENLPGWSFIDWVPTWDRGIAPNGTKLNVHNNLFYIQALQASAEIEAALGEPLLAKRLRDKAAKCGESLQKVFWDEGRGMLADEPEHKHFSEHAQCLALLAGVLPPEREHRAFDALVSEKDISRCTVYFSYYLFETYFKYKRADLFLKRLDLWNSYVGLGLCTPQESPGNARSDCHAWGSHPVYFMHTGLAGVQSIAPGFTKVRIAPCPGNLKKISCKTPHPDGSIETDLQFDDKGGVKGSISLPAGLSGEFVWKGKTLPLKSGRQEIIVP